MIIVIKMIKVSLKVNFTYYYFANLELVFELSNKDVK